MRKIKIKIKKEQKVLMSGDPKNMRKKFKMKLRMMKYPKMMEKAKFNTQINPLKKRLKKLYKNKNIKRLNLYKNKVNLFLKMKNLRKRKDCEFKWSKEKKGKIRKKTIRKILMAKCRYIINLDPLFK